MKSMICSIVATVLLLQSSAAFAYLDPASGSMILQAILGGLAGVAVAGKLFWHQILAFFGLGQSGASPDSTDDSESQ